MNQCILFLVSILVNGICCSRILVLPIQGVSHMILTNTIGQELQSRGHEVKWLYPLVLKNVKLWYNRVFPHHHLPNITEFSKFCESWRNAKMVLLPEVLPIWNTLQVGVHFKHHLRVVYLFLAELNRNPHGCKKRNCFITAKSGNESIVRYEV